MTREKQTQAEFMRDGFEKLIDHLTVKHFGSPAGFRAALREGLEIMNHRLVTRVNSQVAIAERRLVYIGRLERKLTERRQSDSLIIDLARDLEALANAEQNVATSVARARKGGLFERTLGPVESAE